MDFWFGSSSVGFRDEWFRKDAAFDAAIRDRFRTTYERAARGEFDKWCSVAHGALALVIVLVQVPRNLIRDDARAFATDARARAVASESVARGFDGELSTVQRVFMYLPFEHSEVLADQERSVLLFESMEDAKERDAVIEYARRHRDIIRRFGRFPHRNRALGRTSTPEEMAFLATPGSSF